MHGNDIDEFNRLTVVTGQHPILPHAYPGNSVCGMRNDLLAAATGSNQRPRANHKGGLHDLRVDPHHVRGSRYGSESPLTQLSIYNLTQQGQGGKRIGQRFVEGGAQFFPRQAKPIRDRRVENIVGHGGFANPVRHVLLANMAAVKGGQFLGHDAQWHLPSLPFILQHFT